MQTIPHHPYPLKPLSATGILGRSLEIYIDNVLLLTGIVLCGTAPDALLNFINRWAIIGAQSYHDPDIQRISWSPDDAIGKLDAFKNLMATSPWIEYPQMAVHWLLQPVALGALFIALEYCIRGRDCTVSEAFEKTRGYRGTFMGINLIVMILIYASGVAGFICALIPGVILVVTTGVSLDSLPEMFLVVILAIPVLSAIVMIPPVLVFLRTIFSICAAAVEQRRMTGAIGRSWNLFKQQVAPGFWHSHDWRMTVVLTVAGLIALASAAAAAIPSLVDLLVKGGSMFGDGMKGLGLSPLPAMHPPPWSPYLFFAVESLFSSLAILAIAIPVHVYFTDFRVRLENYPNAPEPVPPAEEAIPVAATVPPAKNYLD